jgi:hypothetical protein
LGLIHFLIEFFVSIDGNDGQMLDWTGMVQHKVSRCRRSVPLSSLFPFESSTVDMLVACSLYTCTIFSHAW